jgi:hypothetical protein
MAVVVAVAVGCTKQSSENLVISAPQLLAPPRSSSLLPALLALLEPDNADNKSKARDRERWISPQQVLATYSSLSAPSSAHVPRHSYVTHARSYVREMPLVSATRGSRPSSTGQEVARGLGSTASPPPPPTSPPTAATIDLRELATTIRRLFVIRLR